MHIGVGALETSVFTWVRWIEQTTTLFSRFQKFTKANRLVSFVFLRHFALMGCFQWIHRDRKPHLKMNQKPILNAKLSEKKLLAFHCIKIINPPHISDVQWPSKCSRSSSGPVNKLASLARWYSWNSAIGWLNHRHVPRPYPVQKWAPVYDVTVTM